LGLSRLEAAGWDLEEVVVEVEWTAESIQLYSRLWLCGDKLGGLV
jgi:hypothetical protein